MGPNLATFLNLQWGLKEGLLGYPFGTVDYGEAPVGGSQVTVRGGSDPRSKPLLFYIPFLTERYPFRIPFLVLLSQS